MHGASAGGVSDCEPRDRRVFVQIPAYRDRELGPTLRDLFSTAAAPEELRVAVLWQRAPDDPFVTTDFWRDSLEVIEIPHTESLGCNWARSELQRLWRDEPYTLLLDSHHRFVRHWDRKLISAHNALLSAGIEKPIVTAYLPSYDPELDPEGRLDTPLKIYPLRRTQGLVLRLIGRPILGVEQYTSPLPAIFGSLHCLFTAGRFNRDVPFDPKCYFFGDEVATSLRAFTHGYDLFHPHELIGWHLYDRTTRRTHWADHAAWAMQEAASRRGLETLLGTGAAGTYGCGSARTLADFEDHIGYSLSEKA
jgi:hypothetical protein